MSEHRSNPRAQFKMAMPPEPVGVDCYAKVVPKKVLKSGLLVVAESDYREADGKVEIFGNAPLFGADGSIMNENGQILAEPEPSWHTPPRGFRVIRAGDPMTDDDFDIAHVLTNIVTHKTIALANGQARMTAIELCEVSPRIPYPAWKRAHFGETKLNGS